MVKKRIWMLSAILACTSVTVMAQKSTEEPQGKAIVQVFGNFHAGFGDDSHGEILALQQMLQLVPCPGGQGVAGEVDLGVALALADIVVAALHQFNGGSGAQVAAADADDHENIGVFPDPIGAGLNAAHFFRFLGGGQRQPTQKIAAGTGAFQQRLVGLGDLCLHAQQIRQGQLTPYIGNIHCDHKDRPFDRYRLFQIS